jgi:arylsulfatase A-like enzyme/Tfp pilus assembly protein PilF
MERTVNNRIRRITVPFLALLIAASAAFHCSGRRTERPNVVLIGIDTLRADHLSCYGYRTIRTPNIDALARSGVLVRSANTHIPLTLPSFSTIMTSTLPVSNGVHYNEGFFLDGSARTLAEILRDEGYDTGAVVAAVVLDSVMGISQGFRRYDDEFGEFTAYQAVVRGLEPQFDFTQRRAEEVTDRALELVDGMSGEGPFFLFAHYFDPHSPKDPPPPYSFIDPLLPIGSHERQVQLYDGEIVYTDEHVGRLIRGLEERGLRENTLIVLTADHGEALDEHGERTHGYFTYEPTIHVPLIYSMPGRLPEGAVYEGTAGHIDIAPTILDIIGLADRGEPTFQGRSLYPFDAEEEGGVSYFECVTPYILFGWSGLRGVRSPEWKYISAPAEELYHLTEDPREETNRIDTMPEVADSLRAALRRLVDGATVFEGEGADQQMSVMAEGQVDPAFEEKLRALGYIGLTENVRSGYEDMFAEGLADPKDRLPEYRRMLLSHLFMRWGMALMEQDSIGPAIDQLRTAIETDPQNAQAYFYLGLCHGRRKEYRDAIREMERALEFDPHYIRANLALVDYRIALGDTAAAAGRLEEVESWGSADPQEHQLAAGLWARLGRPDRALEQMEKAYAIDPGFAPARLYLAEEALGRNDIEAARSYLEPVGSLEAESAPFRGRFHYARGRVHALGGEPEAAIESFERAVAEDPTSAAAHNQLGLLYDDRGEYDTALEHYHKALELDPSMVEVYSNIGVSEFKRGRYPEARESFLRYLPHAESAEEAEKVRAFIAHIEELERNAP